MIESSGIVVFEVKLDNNGLYTATSPQLEGVFVAHRDLEKIVADMPNIMKLWFRRHKNLEIEVFSGPKQARDSSWAYPALPVPAEIAAQALAQ